MKITNLLARPFFIGSTGLTKFARGERPRLGQGIALEAFGQPGYIVDGLPDWLYHTDPQLRKEELAGRITIEFSGARTSGVVQPEIDAIIAGGGSGGAETIPLQDFPHLTSATTWRTAGQATIDFDRLVDDNTRIVWEQIQAPGGANSAEVRLYNQSDLVVMAISTGIQTTGPRMANITAFPSGTKSILLQHQVTGGTTPSNISGGTLQTGTL